MKQYSKNDRAEKLMGLRNPDYVSVDTPLDLNYRCPNDYISTVTHYLEWSEYNGFIWCEGCNKDYPSCICLDDPDKATEIFLDSVKQVKEK